MSRDLKWCKSRDIKVSRSNRKLVMLQHFLDPESSNSRLTDQQSKVGGDGVCCAHNAM